MTNISQFLTTCSCGNKTSKAYARAHEGRCKQCVTGLPKESAPSRNARLIDSGWEAQAREEGYYDIPDNY